MQEKSIRRSMGKNYWLLWQGQFVSVFGDAIYDIALSFFVLEITGSTAVMGIIMAFVTIPRVIIGPLAGVVVDNYSRKKLIILADVIRGMSVLIVAYAASKGCLEIWMLMGVAIIFGICTSIFNPAIEAVFPDIVLPENMIKTNSIYQMGTIGATVLGQSFGGTLYMMLGAPIIFLLNGISYLFSAVTEGFIKIPRAKGKEEKVTLFDDFKEGIKFILSKEGLVRTIASSFFINFLFGMIRVLIIPWFTNSSHLGMSKYGVLNAAQSIGLVVGMIILSRINIKTQDKYNVYVSSLLLFVVTIGLAALLNEYILVLIFFFLAFVFQIIFNTILNTTIMIRTPVEKRGKISATKTTLCMAISPVGNFIGGVLCEFYEARLLIIGNTIVALVIIMLVVKNPTVKLFLNDDDGNT